jgi:hypothetical protein
MLHASRSPCRPRLSTTLAATTSLMALAAAPLTAAPDGAAPAEDGPWRKIVINDQSPYEAAGAADFNILENPRQGVAAGPAGAAQSK